ncbi:hypothetical protein AVEN_130332-1 [Araneus ventricosus]|uniref:Uncharacterized protein n=1 Tax=Araneus ventricosus TaxID=182803 RepID=A0A4Y2BEN4_ARAVE|nr:hypothetical protein AVEN_130332-1 [Araneus ventricosus]
MQAHSSSTVRTTRSNTGILFEHSPTRKPYRPPLHVRCTRITYRTILFGSHHRRTYTGISSSTLATRKDIPAYLFNVSTREHILASSSQTFATRRTIRHTPLQRSHHQNNIATLPSTFALHQKSGTPLRTLVHTRTYPAIIVNVLTTQEELRHLLFRAFAHPEQYTLYPSSISASRRSPQ